ncbi:MAG: PLP-dependent transferase, partial [Aquihabitans sp.]
ARVAALEGAPDTAVGLPGALAVASGQAATTTAILNLADAGDHIVASSSLYGGTFNLFRHSMAKIGIEFTFVDDANDVAAWAAAVRPNTKAFFAESIGNPKNDFLDIRAVADTAHAAGVPLIIDNTVATPWLIRPFEHGADIIVHSATKFIGGHANSVGGIVLDAGSFDFSANDKFPGFTEPDPTYNGLTYWPSLGPGSYIIKARVQILRDYGAAVSPFNSFLFVQGLETLSLRMERHSSNAKAVVEYLANHAQVERVQWAGLPDSPYHELATSITGGKGYGSVPAFVIAGGREAGAKFVEGLTLHHHVANLGDVRSLAIHPSSTTHSQLSDDEQAAAGVAPGLVRLSVGIETIADIIADLDRGFAAAAG